MTHLGYYFGIPLQVEVIVCIVFGICFSIFDASLLDLNTNLQKAWAIVLDEDKFSEKNQLIIKYLLSGVVLVKSFSVHIYLAFYIVMLWPVIFEDKPGLLLPWLAVGAIKSIAFSILSTLTGLFICAMYGIFRPVSLDFLISQIINHSPPVYVWYVVFNFYEELKEAVALEEKESKEISNVREAYESELAVRRRKARSMTERQPLHMLDDGRNLISASTIENMLQQLATQLDRKTSRSLDTMLGLMAAEAEKDDILNLYDDVYTTEDSLSVAERTQNLLKLTALEIQQAKLRKHEREKNGLDESMKSTTATDMSVSAGSSQFSDGSRSLFLHKSDGNAPGISPHMSERELRVIESESATSSTIEIVEEDENEATTISTPTVTATTAQLKSILKSEKRRERVRVKDASCQVTGLRSSHSIISQHAIKTVVVPSLKKVSPRTHLTNPTKAVTFSKQSVPVNTEGQENKRLSNGVFSFREDGYTAAYKRQKKNQR